MHNEDWKKQRRHNFNRQETAMVSRTPTGPLWYKVLLSTELPLSNTTFRLSQYCFQVPHFLFFFSTGQRRCTSPPVLEDSEVRITIQLFASNAQFQIYGLAYRCVIYINKLCITIINEN